MPRRAALHDRTRADPGSRHIHPLGTRLVMVMQGNDMVNVVAMAAAPTTCLGGVRRPIDEDDMRRENIAIVEETVK